MQSGIGGFLLKPWDERERSQMEILPEVQAKLDRLPGLQIFGFNLPSLPGTGEGLPFQFVINTANDYETLLQVTERIRKRAEESGSSPSSMWTWRSTSRRSWSRSTARRPRRWASPWKTSA